jgi:sterol desaturase/sphingolipid hydroxylase (fatty acid hydroxylase superfamily)
VIVEVLLGALAWTLLEYMMHRWLGHKFKRNPFGVEHVRHHVEGNYFAPSWKKVIFAAVIAALLALTAGIAFTAGLIGMYAAYEVLHRLEHTHAGIGPYGRWARRHHFHHHFVDGRTNHGVTSPLWDVVFGTYQPAAPVIRVPRKLCMPWLLDPTTNDIRSAHAGTYQLR